jgi:Flp pilus assembly protein TadG
MLLCPTRSEACPRGERGSTTIEFALILPLLVALCFGIVEITNLLDQDRKVSLAVQTITDMVSRMQTICPSDLSDLADAVDLEMRPYDSSYTATIAYVAFDATGKVDLSEGSNSFQFPVAGNYTIPSANLQTIAAGLGIGNDGVIIGEVISNYSPILIVNFMGSGIQLNSTFTERSRQESITYDPKGTSKACTGG